jgi:hypothetical protein
MPYLKTFSTIRMDKLGQFDVQEKKDSKFRNIMFINSSMAPKEKLPYRKKGI